jgi:alpha-amylase/alpha-mannosidase (GH57 family)
VTVNFSPSLLLQIEDFVERDATDLDWELTRVPAERLDEARREAILARFFDADWHNQIFPHPRYRALFEQRRDGRGFSSQDLRDLQVWFNLAWFGKEMRDGPVALPDGTVTHAAELVSKGEGFTLDDVEALLAEQLKIMKAIIPKHRTLARAGQIELSMTPFFHPILPLLIDTDKATVDRPGTSWPPRFAHPEDAATQVSLAVKAFTRWFGGAPRGSWPAEGAVSEDVIPVFARHGIQWIASDQGVLARSGKWGYEVARSEVRHRCYRAEAGGQSVAVFFRDSELSDDIGFRCQAREPEEAARGWVERLKQCAAEEPAGGDRIVTVVLDGENAWSAYRDDGRPFLHALYSILEEDRDIRMVTPTAFLEGDGSRGVEAHPLPSLARVYELFAGSWIDEAGSSPGVDLGTWIGEPEENRAWTLLGEARRDLSATIDPANPGTSGLALLAAEGSDWFWWFGDDQDSGHDPDFDDLFRRHVATAYVAAGSAVPASVAIPIVPRSPLWTFARPIKEIFVGDALVIRTNCPGVVIWLTSAPVESAETALLPVGGAMAGVRRHQVRIGPFLRPGELVFRFECRHPGCDCRREDACCQSGSARLAIRERR